MGSEDVMKAVCWVVIKGKTITITNINDLLYHMIIVFVGTKSTFSVTVYSQKV